MLLFHLLFWKLTNISFTTVSSNVGVSTKKKNSDTTYRVNNNLHRISNIGLPTKQVTVQSIRLRLYYLVLQSFASVSHIVCTITLLLQFCIVNLIWWFCFWSVIYGIVTFPWYFHLPFMFGINVLISFLFLLLLLPLPDFLL